MNPKAAEKAALDWAHSQLDAPTKADPPGKKLTLNQWLRAVQRKRAAESEAAGKPLDPRKNWGSAKKPRAAVGATTGST